MASTKTEKPEKSRTAKPKSKAVGKPAAKDGKDKAPAAKAKVGKAAPPRATSARGKARVTKVPPIKQLELVEEQGEFAEPISSDAIVLEGFAPVPDADDPAAAEPIDEDEDVLHERIVAEQAEIAEAEVEMAPPPLSAEEQELAAIYGDDLSAAPAAAAHAEFSDSRTADEDRPMTPEINGRVERQKRWEERRDQRRSRRDQDRQRRTERTGGPRPAGEVAARPEVRADRPHGPGPDRVHGDARPTPTNGGRDVRAAEARVPEVVRPVVAPVAATETPADLDSTGVIRVGNALGDAAWQVFASIKGAQPMPVRQLAGMMRKRGLIDADPEVLWPHLKAALLGDERSYKSVGLRPRIVYRGRDLFGPGPVAQSATVTAETDLARALSVMAVATHRTLKDRIAQANQAGFERLVHAYLVAAGFRDIEWVKRVEGISYATALPPESASTVLISARAGGQPVDRRGIGELRVGVEAKQLLAGYLFSARELSSDAERELERNGRSITVIAGDSFVSALLALGVGVVTAAAPVRYVDDQLLGELLAG